MKVLVTQSQKEYFSTKKMQKSNSVKCNQLLDHLSFEIRIMCLGFDFITIKWLRKDMVEVYIMHSVEKENRDISLLSPMTWMEFRVIPWNRSTVVRFSTHKRKYFFTQLNKFKNLLLQDILLVVFVPLGSFLKEQKLPDNCKFTKIF